MPEYSQVETWAECSETTLPAVLERYLRALGRVGYDTVQLDDWLAGIRWYPESEVGGAAGLGPFQAVTAPGGEVVLEVAPFLITWTYAPSRSVAQVYLLFETERVLDIEGRYRPGTGPALWWMMRALHAEFNESGVFLTNEATDGKATEHLLTGETEIGGPDVQWWFDAALLPFGLADHFRPVPATHVVAPVAEGVAAADRRSWEATGFPWDQPG